MMIIGVDPGTVTGIALWDTASQRVTFTAQEPAADAVGWLWTIIDHNEVTVACERYDITRETVRKTRNYDALYVTGAVLFKCRLRLSTFVQYGRADAKRLVTDQRLRDRGLYVPGKEHVRDALRQVFTYLAHTDPKTFLEFRGTR